MNYNKKAILDCLWVNEMILKKAAFHKGNNHLILLSLSCVCTLKMQLEIWFAENVNLNVKFTITIIFNKNQIDTANDKHLLMSQSKTHTSLDFNVMHNIYNKLTSDIAK